MQIENYNLPYNTVFHFMCLKNCIRQILDYYGVKGSLFYINCVPDIILERRNNLSGEYTVAYQSNLSPILPKYSNRLKKFTYKEINSPEAWDDVLLKICEGYPVITMVDTFELKYRSKDYHKNHGSHAIIVHDYDPVSEELKIIDWYEPFFYKGSISKTEYLAARNSSNTYSNNPFSGHLLENEWFFLIKEGWDEEQRTLLMDSFKLYLGYNSNSFSTERINTYVGVNALEILAKKLSTISWSNRKEIENFYNNIYCEYKAKHLFLYYLKTYQEDNPSRFLDGVVLSLTKLCAEWDAATALLLKTIITSSPALFDKAHNRLSNILKQENNLVCVISEAYNRMLNDF